MTPAQSELVKAHKRGDRAALARVADRMGLVRLSEAIASTEPGRRRGGAVGGAAGARRPVVDRRGDRTDRDVGLGAGRGGGRRAGRAARRVAAERIEEWDVPADVVARACTSLRALAWRADAALATRLAALDAVAAAAPTCGRGADLAPLARDNVPAVRRAA